MERIHIYLDAQYIGILACPQCGTRRAVNIPQQCPQVLEIVGEKIATITCRCGAVFESYFDLRRHPRKIVQFEGELVDPQTGVTLGTMLISSLSVHGLGFVLATTLRLHIGEIYLARFCLDDAEQSHIHERIIIRRLHGNTVGAEFYPVEQYNYALDFYVYGTQLMPPLRPGPGHVRRLSGTSPLAPTPHQSPAATPAPPSSAPRPAMRLSSSPDR